MGKFRTEMAVGVFLVVGFLAFGWLAVQLGEVPWLTKMKTYGLNAEFDNIAGLKIGADVQISGVTVGKVQQISLNKKDDTAVVAMQLDREIKVPVDSVASVKSQGIIGDKYIQISLGGDKKMYQPGESIFDTESAVDLESLISKFVFGKVNK